MGIVQSFKNLASRLNDFGSYTYSEEPVVGNLPVFPEWFFSAHIGQPRKINIQEVRSFAQSPWVQMVLNTQKREISTIEWDIITVDPDESIEQYETEVAQIKDFLKNINTEGETIDDYHSSLLTDIGEIDAGVGVKVYTNDSYEEVTVPMYDEQGNELGTRTETRLKPFGERTLAEVRTADGGSFLKQIDIYKRLIAYYQYSFKNPRTNPKKFDPEEVIYYCMNKRPYSLYGFSPLQSVLQVVETLTQATRWNKDFFKNNAMASGIISLPGVNAEQLKLAKREWDNQVKGKPHKMIFQNTPAEFQSFATSARDMEWLDGQKWYFHLVFAAYGISPVEAGFHENVNQGNQAGQERITVKNGIKPHLTLFENMVNNKIITEILQDEKPKLKFIYKPKEHVEEQIEFEQNTKLVELGAMTINEFRKMRGQDPVEWGDEPINSMSDADDTMEEPQQDPQQQQTDSRQREFRKKFEEFLS